MQHHTQDQEVGTALMPMQLITEMMRITHGLAMSSGSMELMRYQIFMKEELEQM